MKRIISLLALASLAACSEVPTGNRGVFVNYGKPTEVVSEGLHWYNPWSYDLALVDVRQLKWGSDTEAYTRDVQQARIKFTLTYSLEPSAVMKVYQTVGTDWASNLIPQVVEQSIKDVFGRAEAVRDTINNRQRVVDLIQADIRAKLRKRNVIVHGFEVNDISFSQAFEEAVEQKQIAVENANAARNKTVEIEENAKQRVIAAEADAKAMQIKTLALSGNAKLVEYEAVQKWDGVLPQNMYGGAMPFVSVGK